ncbi:MAG: deoxyribose-phosphate aldolase [Bdellovibrionaceae bacterium]|nr:deoxyribose-phosphate aldolase [Bdellovibrio sp.]
MAKQIDLTKPQNLAKFIDHTLLKPEATKNDVRKLCEEALENQFYAVCVNSWMVTTCREILRSTKINVATVVGFPLGAVETSVKAFETTRALNLGADEIDMVLNIGALKAKDYGYVEKEIQSVVRAAEGRTVKVIFETCLLTEDEKKRACELSLHGGAHFVKTSTGFSTGGATVEDVKLMAALVGSKAHVKASGSIRDYLTAVQMIEAGATRLGTSSGVYLVKGENATSRTY